MRGVGAGADLVPQRGSERAFGNPAATTERDGRTVGRGRVRGPRFLSIQARGAVWAFPGGTARGKMKAGLPNGWAGTRAGGGCGSGAEGGRYPPLASPEFIRRGSAIGSAWETFATVEVLRTRREVAIGTVPDGAQPNEGVRRQLEALVLDNSDLERLETIVGDFNPFVAMRWVRQEARHSQFLRWLLDPAETHGLGDYCLRAFLKGLAAKATGTPEAPSVIDADAWGYGNTLVLTEWNAIDLTIRNDELDLIVAIENKLDSTEHSQQLQRYRSLINDRYPTYQKLFVLLSVEGDAPSDEAYISLSYSELAALVAEVSVRRGDQIGPEIRTFIDHYVEMLRRHIVQDSEIQDLCRRIYQAHRHALDMIFEHRPDRTLEMSEFVKGLIGGETEILLDHCSKAYVRFLPSKLDFIPKSGSGWTPSGRLVLFEIDFSGSDVGMKVILGPGLTSHRDIVHTWVRGKERVFNRAATTVYPKWWSFHSERWITTKQFESMELEELRSKLRDSWARFKRTEFPSMVEGLEGLRSVEWPST